MGLDLRFEPSISFKRLLALPQIDEDGVVYADAFDLIGTASKGTAEARVDIEWRQRGKAPSPENVPKLHREAVQGIAIPERPKLPETVEASSRMPGFHAINAPLPPDDAHRVGVGALDIPGQRPHPPPRPRSPTLEILELPSRDWSLSKIVGKRNERGVHLYKTKWEPTMLDSSVVRIVDDTPWVRYRGVDWPVETLEDPVLNDDTGVHEVNVSWEESWHPTWEFATARESLVEWESANHPWRAEEKQRHLWWRYPMSVFKYRDPERHTGPILHRDIVGDEIVPELHCDYTFALLQLLLDEVESSERGLLAHSAIVDLVNRPLRQRLVFNGPFVRAGGRYRLHREELVRAAIVYIVGLCRQFPCNICTDASEELPFSKCVVSGKIFDGCCANCVATYKRPSCDVHADVLPFKEAQEHDNDDPIEDDAISIPSSPLPDRDVAARSSVDPEDSLSRTPPTSPSIHGNHIGGGSPELGSDSLIFTQRGQSLRSTKIPEGPKIDGANELQSGTSETSGDGPAPKKKWHRKRKSSFRDEKPQPARQRVGKEDAPNTDGSPTASASGSSPPPVPKTEYCVEDEKEFKHPGCPGNGRPCTNPICGTPVPLGDHFPGMVYRDHKFKRDGEATEDQVRFIISRMQCSDTQFIQKSWDDWQATYPGGGQHLTKYSLLTMAAGHLNKFVRSYCPLYVDLTLDD